MEDTNTTATPEAAPSAEATTAAEAPAEKLEFTLEEWETELAKAEQKGYLRGKNERIKTVVARPGLFENATVETVEKRLASPDSFLAHRRPSVWD